MRTLRKRLFAVSVVCLLGCSDSTPSSPNTNPTASSIDRLQLYVRNWPNEEVELDLNRENGERVLTLYRPARDGNPQLLLASISPEMKEWSEVEALLESFDVWAMAEPDAPGAACRTYQAQWICSPTVNDYSLVMRVIIGGVTRNQRYTRLNESASNQTARALGDFVLSWARKREGAASSAASSSF